MLIPRPLVCSANLVKQGKRYCNKYSPSINLTGVRRYDIAYVRGQPCQGEYHSVVQRRVDRCPCQATQQFSERRNATANSDRQQCSAYAIQAINLEHDEKPSPSAKSEYETK